MAALQRFLHKSLTISLAETFATGPRQGRIQSKFEGGAVGSEGAEIFSEIDDDCTLYSLCKEIFHNNCVYFEEILELN